jgi:CMP-N,N'-diacetyllegionaminic acid synthase
LKPICFIAARGGSKGVPNKNIRIIDGKPLISHAIETAIKSKLFSHVIVSTDSKKIRDIAISYGAESPTLRPKRLAKDSIGIIHVLIHEIKILKKLGYDFDTVVTRDCTVPFINSKHMKESISLLQKKDCHGVYAVYRQHLNPYFNMVEPNPKGFLRISKKPKEEIKSRQKAPLVYQLNGLFTFNVESLLKYKKLFMPKTIPYEISQKSGFMIDTLFEFKIAKFLFEEKF